MVQYQILYWKNIPAQYRVFEPGKRPVSHSLPGRQEEIDRVATSEGLTGSDAYLEQWNWSEKLEREGTVEEVSSALLLELSI